MANLSSTQIDELKNKGFVTQVVPSADLASQSVDDLKDKNYITQVVPSADIEASIVSVIPVESISFDDEQLNINTLIDDVNVVKRLGVTITPDNATNPTVTYESSNPIVTVEGVEFEEEGVITRMCKVTIPANTNGNITITASAGDKTAECLLILTTA